MDNVSIKTSAGMGAIEVLLLKFVIAGQLQRVAELSELQDMKYGVWEGDD